MKNFIASFVLSMVAITLLPGCWYCAKHRYKTVQPSPLSTVDEKRVSGPLSDTDIQWTEDDFK